MDMTPYKKLAERLDALPNGFPPAPDGSELQLLAYLFTPEEAELAAKLRLAQETPDQLAERIGGDPKTLRRQLKSMAKRGLITAGKAEGGMGYGLMPFVVGIYEMQLGSIDKELAGLFERYYLKAFGDSLSVQPPVHRVVPVGESVRMGLEVQPYESLSEIVSSMQAWGVSDCICRTQKQLIGDPCDHPVENCLVMSPVAGVFDNRTRTRALSKEGALDVLRQAAEAGLVHSVSNSQEGVWYVCNCCTCSCAVLRGMKDLGIANVVARSAYLCQVDGEACMTCGGCVFSCQFDAIELMDELRIDTKRCVGCGVCTLVCPEGALSLDERPSDEVLAPPATHDDWMVQRANSRQIDLDRIR